jgi:hypothetical protein
LLPTLQGLGVPPEKIKEEIIRMYELPKTFNDVIEQAAPASAPGPSAADVANIEGGPTTNETSAQQLASALQG